jgi:predicted GNAT family acetyltransferase
MKFIKLYENFNQIELVLDDESNNYHRYNIVSENEKVGMIEYYDNRNTLEIISIEIDEDKRGKGFGKFALKELIRINKKKILYELTADCVSQESFFTFISVYGKPDMFCSMFKEFKTYDEVKEYLPLKAPYDSEGNMIGSSDSSVFVRYNFKKLIKKIK